MSLGASQPLILLLRWQSIANRSSNEMPARRFGREHSCDGEGKDTIRVLDVGDLARLGDDLVGTE